MLTTDIVYMYRKTWILCTYADVVFDRSLVLDIRVYYFIMLTTTKMFSELKMYNI